MTGAVNPPIPIPYNGSAEKAAPAFHSEKSARAENSKWTFLGRVFPGGIGKGLFPVDFGDTAGPVVENVNPQRKEKNMANEYSLGDIAAVTERGGFGGSGWGDGGWWILLLFIILGGNRGWGSGFGNNGSYAGGDQLYPWLNQAQLTTQGFADQNTVMALNGIQSGVQNLATQLCNCCADNQMALANGFAGVEAGANARQMANMQQMFDLSTQFANCCCENRLATANLQADIAREACATRQNQNDNTQAVLNKLSELEKDGYLRELAAERRENDQLRQQLAQASLAASQIAQDTRIIDGIYNRLATCPVGTQPVYGNQPIYTCNGGCGCGAN